MRPCKQLDAPRHRKRHPGWKLVRRRDEHRSRLGRRAQPSLDDNSLSINGDGVRPNFGYQELSMGQGIARVFDPHIVARRQQHSDGDVDRMLGPGGDDDLLGSHRTPRAACRYPHMHRRSSMEPHGST
jgi:hypothetical protein